MATGSTTTGALADSLDDIRSAARIVREHVGQMESTADMRTLGEGIGASWQEISYNQLTAQDVTESTELDNPQQLADNLLTVTPSMIQIETFLTDNLVAKMNRKGLAETGALAMNAIRRRKNADGLALFASAGTTLAGAGTTLTSGHITAAVAQITADATEPPPDSTTMYFVAHGYQVKDIEDELNTGTGTYPVPTGLSEDVFRMGLVGQVGGALLKVDGNIQVDGNTDVRGAVFAGGTGGSVVRVQGMALKVETYRRPMRGGGGDSIFIRDDYAWGERSAGNWLYGVLSDGTAPTS